jgi:hypothetical protein
MMKKTPPALLIESLKGSHERRGADDEMIFDALCAGACGYLLTFGLLGSYLFRR